jgi:hypothetical protein
VKPVLGSLVVLVGCAALAHAAPGWEFVYKPFQGNYVVYGGSLRDPHAPARGDNHIAFAVRGQAAKDMFDAIGPDLKRSCGPDDPGRMRAKDSVSCRYRKVEGYVCDFGFDLTTGKSIPGSAC